MKVANWKIGRKLAVAFGFLALVTAVVGVLTAIELRAIAVARAELVAQTTSLSGLREARFYMARQENSFRGFLLTGDDYYLERLASHHENFLKKISEAADAYVVDEQTPARIEAARTAANAWYALVDAAATGAKTGQDRSVAVALVGNDGPADQAMGPAEDAIDALIDSAVASRQETNTRLDQSVQLAMLYLVIGAAISALAAALIGWLATRAIARPLVSLTRVMEDLAAGIPIGDIGSRERQDEIGAMSRSVQVFKEQALALDSASMAVDDGKAMLAGVHRALGIVEFDLSGNVLTANENFLKTVGYSLSDIQGRHHSMFVDQDYAASPQYAEFWRRLNSGEAKADKFVRFGRGGSKVVIEASYNLISGADGKPYKIVKFATDVTAQELGREQRAEADAATARTQKEIVAETAAGLTALASGDLSYRIDQEFPGEYARLKSDFNAAMGKLEDAMGVIRSNASAMQTGAGEISQAADDLSRRTEQQAATLEETAAALDQITATVRRTADGAQRANVVVADARRDAETSGQVVTRAVTAMGEIQKSSEQISQIIGVIDEIAFQTNLLALNAGVEAARAGDAGRGFAVVASEVRALAQRSAEAAKEIKSLISASSTQVRDGVGLVGQTGEALTSIVGRVMEINGLMAEINASAQEQATALGQVNTAVNQMDQTTQQNAAMVEQSTAASHNLSQEAGELAQLVGRFQIGSAPADPSRRPQRAPTHATPSRPQAHRPTTNPVRDAQARISTFASELAPRRSGSAALALAPSNQAEWEEF